MLRFYDYVQVIKTRLLKATYNLKFLLLQQLHLPKQFPKNFTPFILRRTNHAVFKYKVKGIRKRG